MVDGCDVAVQADRAGALAVSNPSFAKSAKDGASTYREGEKNAGKGAAPGRDRRK